MKLDASIIKRIQENDPTLPILDLSSYELSQSQLEEFQEALQTNNQLCYIKWGRAVGGADDLRQEINQKAASNLQKYEYHPNDHTLVLLTSHVNSPNSLANSALSDWEALKRYDDQSGYHGVLYSNKKTAQLVLAHRSMEKGTSSPEDAVKATLDTLNGKDKAAFERVLEEVTKDAVEIAKNKNYHLTFTGHAFGGFLAELSQNHSQSLLKQTKAVVFDSPGIITSEESKGWGVVHYFTVPNCINTYNEHTGMVYTVFPEESKSAPLFREKDSDASIFMPVPLQKIVEQFDPLTGKPKKYEAVLDWPLGIGSEFGINHMVSLEPVIDVIDVVDDSPGSGDWYLKRLKDHMPLRGQFTCGSLAEKEAAKLLESLASRYEWDFDRYKVVFKTSDGTSVERLRDVMNRVLETVPGAKECIQNAHRIDSVMSVTTDLGGDIVDGFSGREVELKKVDAYFQSGEKIVVIKGPKTGKTSFAAEYGKRESEKDAESIVRFMKDLPKGYKKLAFEFGLSTDVSQNTMRNLVNAKLETMNKPVLFILDAQDCDSIKEYINNLPNNVRALITAKSSPQCGNQQKFKSILLPEFSHEEATQYLEKKLPGMPETQKIIDEVGRMPYKLSEMADCLEKDPFSTVEECASQVNMHTWRTDLLLKGEDGKSGIRLLGYMAHLNPDFIPISLLKGLKFDRKELSGAIKALESLSLSYPVDGKCVRGITLHPGIQEEARRYIGAQERKEIIKTLSPLTETLFKSTQADEEYQEGWCKLHLLSNVVSVCHASSGDYCKAAKEEFAYLQETLVCKVAGDTADCGTV